MENKVLFWDFDGTLVYCHHLWSSSMWRALTDEPSGENITLEEGPSPYAEGLPLGLARSGLFRPFHAGTLVGFYGKSTFTVSPVLSVCRKNPPFAFPAPFGSTS